MARANSTSTSRRGAAGRTAKRATDWLLGRAVPAAAPAESMVWDATSMVVSDGTAAPDLAFLRRKGNIRRCAAGAWPRLLAQWNQRRSFLRLRAFQAAGRALLAVAMALRSKIASCPAAYASRELASSAFRRSQALASAQS